MPSNNYGEFSSAADQTPSATQTALSKLGIESPQQGVATLTEAPEIAGLSSDQIAWNNTGTKG
jgi:hypothetical protein